MGRMARVVDDPPPDRPLSSLGARGHRSGPDQVAGRQRLRLYLIRHASADEPREGQSDADRALTREGIETFQKAAAGIARLVRESG